MSYTESKDKTRLFYKIDHAENAQASAMIIHGFGDHCGRYDDFIDYLLTLGISVIRFDYRGHGRSEGRRGHIMSFGEYLDDLESIMVIHDQNFELKHKVLFAHSNGALIATHALAQLPELQSWSAAILSSPFYAIKVKVPKWKSFLGSKLSKLIPTLGLPTDLEPSHMSHDQDIIDAYATDPLIGRVASARWLTETLQAHDQVKDQLAQINIPVLMQLAGEDYIADSQLASALFEHLSSKIKTLKQYDDLYHEIWFEDAEKRAKVFVDLKDFLHSMGIIML